MFSGGVDSTILVYLILKYNPNTKLVCHTMKVDGRPFVEHATKLIISWMRQEFPKCKLVHTLHTIPDEKEALDISLTEYQWVKTLAIQDVHEEYNFKMYNGITSHYDKLTMIKYNLWDTRDLNRYPDDLKFKPRAPLYNKDKHYVKNLYDDHDLIDRLLPLTISCPHSTKGGTPCFPVYTPCCKCEVCIEKYIAFNSY